MLHVSPPEDTSCILLILFTDKLFYFFSLSCVLFSLLTAAAGYRAAEGDGGSGGLHSRVRLECSVEPDG